VNLLIGTIAVDVILLMAGIFAQHHALGRAVHDVPFGSSFTPISTGRLVRSNTCWRARLPRWHHTALEEGGNTNFAGTFPIWDILFGTFRMPEEKLPNAYGVDDQQMPSEIGGQLAYPFRQL